MPGVSARVWPMPVVATHGETRAGDTNTRRLQPGNVSTGWFNARRRRNLWRAPARAISAFRRVQLRQLQQRRCGPVITTGWSALLRHQEITGSTLKWISGNPQPRSRPSIRSIFPACRCSTSMTSSHRARIEAIDVPRSGAGHPRNDVHPSSSCQGMTITVRPLRFRSTAPGPTPPPPFDFVAVRERARRQLDGWGRPTQPE